MAEETKYASFNPDEATVQGLFDEGEFEFQGPRIDFFSYNSGEKGVGLITSLKELSTGTIYENQFWSAGGEDKVVPAANNTRLAFCGTSTTLNVKSNFVKLMASLKNVGVPVNLLDGADIRKIDGLKVKLVRTPNPDAQKNQKGEQPKVITAVKLIGLPGGKTTAGGSASVKGAPTPAASAPAAGGDLDERVTKYLLEALDAAGGSLAKKEVSAKTFQIATKYKDADKVAISKRVFADEFLVPGGMIEVDGNVLAFEYDADAKVIKKAA